MSYHLSPHSPDKHITQEQKGRVRKGAENFLSVSVLRYDLMESRIVISSSPCDRGRPRPRLSYCSSQGLEGQTRTTTLGSCSAKVDLGHDACPASTLQLRGISSPRIYSLHVYEFYNGTRTNICVTSSRKGQRELKAVSVPPSLLESTRVFYLNPAVILEGWTPISFYRGGN